MLNTSELFAAEGPSATKSPAIDYIYDPKQPSPLSNLPSELLVHIMQMDLMVAVSLATCGSYRFSVLYKELDSLWKHFLPKNQQSERNGNRAVFFANLARLERKLGVRLFKPQSETLTIPTTLNLAELQRLTLLIPYMSYTNIQFSEGQVSAAMRKWQQIFDVALGKREFDQFSMLENFPPLVYVEPVLHHLPVKAFALNVYQDNSAQQTAEEREKAAQLRQTQMKKLIVRIPEWPLDKFSLLSYRDNSPAGLLEPALSELAKLKILRPLSIRVAGCNLNQNECENLGQFIANNPMVYRLIYDNNYGQLSESLLPPVNYIMDSKLRELSINGGGSLPFTPVQLEAFMANLPSSLKTLRLQNMKLKSDDLAVIARYLKDSNITMLDLKWNKFESIAALGNALANIKITHLILSSNDRSFRWQQLAGFETIANAYINDNLPLEFLNLYETRLNQGSFLLLDMIKKNGPLQHLYIETCWNIERAEPALQFYNDLSQALSQNFVISHLGYNKNYAKQTGVCTELKDFLSRNHAIAEAKYLLGQVKAGKYKSDMAKITKILEADISKLLTQVKEIAEKYQEKFPEGYQACLKICNELADEANNLNDRSKKATTIQSFFRGHQARKHYHTLLQAKAIVDEYKASFGAYLFRENKFSEVNDFAEAMLKKDYRFAANMIISHVRLAGREVNIQSDGALHGVNYGPK